MVLSLKAGTLHSPITHRIHAVVTGDRYPTQPNYSPAPWCCHWRQVPYTVWLLTGSMVLSLETGTPHSLITHRLHGIVIEGRYPTQSDYSLAPWCCHWRQVPYTVWLLTGSMLLSLETGTPHSLITHRLHGIVIEGRYPTQYDYSPAPWCCHWRQVPHTVWLLTGSMVLSLKAGTPHSLITHRLHGIVIEGRYPTQSDYSPAACCCHWRQVPHTA